MTISYPITLPLKPGKRRVVASGSNSAAMTASPWTGSQQTQVNPAQGWSFSLELPPMGELLAREWFGKLLSLRGIAGSFYLGDPLWQTPRGSFWTGAVINGVGQSGAMVNVTGVPGGIGKTGDYLQLGSGVSSRLHITTQDFVADGAGNAAVDIFPSLRESPLNGDPVVTSGPQGIFRLASPNVARDWEPFRYGISIDVVEYLTA